MNVLYSVIFKKSIFLIHTLPSVTVLLWADAHICVVFYESRENQARSYFMCYALLSNDTRITSVRFRNIQYVMPHSFSDFEIVAKGFRRSPGRSATF